MASGWLVWKLSYPVRCLPPYTTLTCAAESDAGLIVFLMHICKSQSAQHVSYGVFFDTGQSGALA